MSTPEVDLAGTAVRLAAVWRSLSARQMGRVPTCVRLGIVELGRAVARCPQQSGASEWRTEHTAANSVVVRLTRVDNPVIRFRGPLDAACIAPGNCLTILGPRGCVTTAIRSLSPLAKGRFFIETQNSAYLLSIEAGNKKFHVQNW